MTKTKIQKIYQRYCVPDNIIRHMQKVGYVCGKLSESFKKAGIKVDKTATVQAALLHDVIRVVDFSESQFAKFCSHAAPQAIAVWQKLRKKYQNSGHEKGMAKELIKIQQKKLAGIIAKHGFFEVYNLKTLEEKILFYGDKRVEHDKVVSLKKRFSEGKKRNLRPDDDQLYVKKTEIKVYQLEKEFQAVLKSKLIKF